MYFIAILLWGLYGFYFGFISRSIARNKGRDAGLWFVAAFVFGPLALAVALLPSIEKKGVTKMCLNCRSIIKTEATTCPYCQSDVKKGG